MASRAHVLHDYSFGKRPGRARREVWYGAEEPVTLPRAGLLRASGGPLLAGLTAAVLIAGSAYAVLYTPPPAMAITPTTPLTREFVPDPQLARANVDNQLSGPAQGVPETDRLGAPFAADEPLFSGDRERGSEVLIDDSAPGAQQSFPQPSSTQSDPSAAPPESVLPDTTPQAPYPDPTLTPPEGIAPDTAPSAPSPGIDPENPYQ